MPTLYTRRFTAQASWEKIDHAKSGSFVGRLTTHVLDTAHGCPGAGILVRLYADGHAAPLMEIRTNQDGRCDRPLLEGDGIKLGRYRLVFAAGAYFKARGVALADLPFIDEVTVAFGIADAAAHYHVPLLVSPFAYSTYRGS